MCLEVEFDGFFSKNLIVNRKTEYIFFLQMKAIYVIHLILFLMQLQGQP